MRIMELVWPPAAKAMLFGTGVVAAFAASFAAAVVASGDSPFLILVPLSLVGTVAAGWVVAMAFAGSPAAIMAYLAVIVFVNDAQFRVRGAGNTEADWQSMLKFAVWIGAGVIGFGHLPLARRLFGRPGSALWLTYIAVALISSSYSPVPGYTFGCALALLCLFAFAGALLVRLSMPQILWTFVAAMTAFNAVSWAAFILYPELGSNPTLTLSGTIYRMCGIAGQATMLGYADAQYIAAVFLLWWAGRCRLLPALAFMGFGAATLVATDCRTMIFAVALGIAAVAASRSLWLMMGAVLAVLSVMVVVTLAPDLVSAVMGASGVTRSGDPSELYTMTGRLEIWDYAWQLIQQQPVLGWGYNSSKVVLGTHLGFGNGLMVDSAHNLLLQSMLSVGVVGTLPLVGTLALLTWRLFTQSPPLVVFVTVIVLVGAVSDTVALGTTPTVLTLLFILASIWPEPLARRRAGPLPSLRRVAGIGVPARFRIG